MADLFKPTTSGTVSGQMSFNAVEFSIDEAFRKNIESINIRKRDKFLIKQTGFQYTKRQLHPISGTTELTDISINFVSVLTRPEFYQLVQLAKALNGASGLLIYRDDLASDRTYTGRWVNAGAFRDDSEILSTAAMELETYSYTAN